MALISALVLILVLLLRPMELWATVAQLHLLEVLSAATAIGIGMEMSRGERGSAWSPQLKWLGAFLVWGYAVSVLRLGVDAGLKAGWAVTLGPLFTVLVVLALRTVSRLRAVAALLLVCSAFVSAVSVHQGQQPRQCIEQHEDRSSPDKDVEPIPDGRECEGKRMCENGGVAGSDYLCERVGLFGTFSTAGRVRWRGQLDDPNEVAVFIGALLPFLAMFAARPGRSKKDAPPVAAAEEPDHPRSVVLFIALLLTLGLGLWAAVLTQSRGGQLVIGTVTVGILLRRFGWWSLVAGAVVTLPIVLLAWREGADAESSSLERAEILNEGLLMLKAHPLLGIGLGQFAGENPLNMAAHNSYLLVATEAGFPGYLLWCGLVWSTVKIPLVIARRPPAGLDPSLILFAEALTVSMLGLLVGVFFLSFVYKHIFFVWLGLASALYGAVREDHPDFEVRTTGRDLAGILALAVVSLVAVRVVASTAR